MDKKANSYIFNHTNSDLESTTQDWPRVCDSRINDFVLIVDNLGQLEVFPWQRMNQGEHEIFFDAISVVLS